MALSNASITALNQWAQTQEFSAYGQVDGNPATSATLGNLGNLLDSGKMLNDNYRDELVQTIYTIPAPGNATTDGILWVPIVGGTIQSVQVVCPANWSATTTTAATTTLQLKTFNNSATAALTPAFDMLTGLAGGTPLTLPTNASTTAGLALLTVTSTTVSMSASSANLTVTTTGTWVNQPNAGDSVVIVGGGTNVKGTNSVNVGLYTVTSATTNQMVLAKKGGGTNPGAVTAVAVAAGDVTGMVLIPANNPVALTAGTLLGIEIVQVSTAIAVTQPVTFLIRYRPA